MPSDNPSDWLEEDLLRLIRTPVEESLELEYKASPSLENTSERKNEIRKDVSSFANAAGGTIVYGITESDGVPQALDGLNPATTSKEWLEQVISGIRPRLEVHINPILLTTQQPGRVAYVVSIPQGKTAHQASDLKYYKRHNFQSVPMEDHEIRDVMARSRHPVVEPIFSFLETRDPQPKLLLRTVLRNVGAMTARDIKLVVLLPLGMFSAENSSFVGGGRKEIDGQIYDRFFLQRTDLIIFPDDEFLFTENFGPLTSTKRVAPIDIYTSTTYDLRWKIYADDMPPKEGRMLFRNIPASPPPV